MLKEDKQLIELLTKRDVLKRGRMLLNKYDLHDWRVAIDSRPKRRYGECRYASKTIGVSSCFIDMANQEESFNANFFCEDEYDPLLELDWLLLHEIAHALTPDKAHQIPWQDKYAELLAEHFYDFIAKRCLMKCRFCNRRFREGKFEKCFAKEVERSQLGFFELNRRWDVTVPFS